MASVPATTDAELSADSGAQRTEITLPSTPGGELIAGFGSLDILRQLGLMLGLAASVAIGFAVVLWSQSGDYQPIYGNMSGYDSQAIMEALDAEGTDYRVDPASGVILVEADAVAAIRLRLAAAGVTRYGGTGYELLDEDSALGTSQFMEANRVKRSQEGELQRTIMSFRNVQSARVHIAIPERSVFVRSSNRPSASVFLVLNSGSSLSDTQIEAIGNLVASSVPELLVEDVTIVDQRGNLLSRKEGDTAFEMAEKQFAYTRRFEQTLVERIRSILSPIVGYEGFQAQVTAEIDFTRVEQAAESYDPTTQVLRSEQTLDERSLSGEQMGGIPGALSNQPPADGVVADGVTAADLGVEDGNVRTQATRNYELGRQLSYTNRDPVALKRLSVAVVLDDKPALDEETPNPWTDAQLEQLTALVRDAVAFDENRGDSVTVINNSFASMEIAPSTSVPIWQQPWVMSLGKQLLGLLFVLVMVVGVLRPVLKNLATAGTESRQLALAATQGDFNDFAMDDRRRYDGDNMGPDGMLLGGGSVTGYETQLGTVRGLVAEDPSRVAQVVKKWVTDDGE